MLLPDHLLHLQAIHQRLHHYIPCHKFVSRVDNDIYDRLYCSRDLTDAGFQDHIDALHPQNLPWRLWTPPSELVYTIASMLRWTKLLREYLLVKRPLPMGTGQSETSYIKSCPLTPY